ncbi:prepilin-type N-terminal cleavage/methylation domain-containing protein [Rhodoplanes sp. P11]
MRSREGFRMLRPGALRPRRDGARRDGFTLVEALVALAVVAASLAAIGTLIATTVRKAAGLETRLVLVETARAVEAGLADRRRLEPGSFGGMRAGYRWRVDAVALAEPPPDPARPAAERGRPARPPLAIVIRVEAPNGQVLRVDTARLGRRPG